MTIRGYQFALDWAGDGTFAEPGDDVTGRDLDGITVSWGRAEGLTTNPATAGELQVALQNMDRVLSPEVSGVDPVGVRARYQVTHPVDLTTTVLFDGLVDGYDYAPTSAARTMGLSCQDAWGRPDGERLSTPLYKGIRTGAAVNVVLDAIGWTGGRDIDAGATLIDWWWVEDKDAATAIGELVDSEGPPAIAFVQGGTFVFRDRHHRLLNTASTTNQATFSHAVPAGTAPAGSFKVGRDYTYDYGLDRIVNAVTFAVDERAPQLQQQVWSDDGLYAMTTGETIDIEAQAGDPFFDAVTPVAGVDFVQLTGSVKVALSRTSGQSVTIRLTAIGGPATVRGMALRAEPATVVRTVPVTFEDPASVAKYRRRAWERPAPWANRHDAYAIAQALVGAYAVPRPTVTFTITDLDTSYLQQVLYRKVSDRVRVKLDEVGLDASMFIERISHTVAKPGIRGLHSVTFSCQVVGAVASANAFTFDVAGKGFGQGSFEAIGVIPAASMFRFDTAGQGFNQGSFAY